MKIQHHLRVLGWQRKYFKLVLVHSLQKNLYVLTNRTLLVNIGYQLQWGLENVFWSWSIRFYCLPTRRQSTPSLPPALRWRVHTYCKNWGFGPILGHDIALLFGDIHIAHTWLPFSLTEPYFIVELSFVTGLEEISDEDLGKFRETSNISLTKWHKRSQNQIYTNWPREYVLVIFISFYFWQLGV